MYCQTCGGKTVIRFVDGRERPVCQACGAVTWLDPKLAVAVVIVRDGRILLGRRASHTRAAGGWSFPAGFVDRGEVVEAAAIREVREETGLSVSLGPVLGVFSEPGEAVVLIAWPAISVSGTLTPGDDLTETGWFDPGQLPPLAFAHDSAIVNAWRAWRDSLQPECESTRPHA